MFHPSIGSEAEVYSELESASHVTIKQEGIKGDDLRWVLDFLIAKYVWWRSKFDLTVYGTD